MKGFPDRHFRHAGYDKAFLDHGKDSDEILTHRLRAADRQGSQPQPGVHQTLLIPGLRSPAFSRVFRACL
jgi:hypothetical protein